MTRAERRQLPRWLRARTLVLPVSICIRGRWHVSPDCYGPELVAWAREIERLRGGSPLLEVQTWDDPTWHEAITRVTLARQHGVNAGGGVS